MSDESRIVIVNSAGPLAEAEEFRPQNTQKLWKARLAVAIQDKGIDVRLTPLTPERAQALAPDKRMAVWGGQPGFWDWALNTTELRVRRAYMMNQAMDALDSLLSNEEPKAQSARLGAVRLLMELSDAFPKKTSGADPTLKKVGAMNAEEVDAAIEALGYAKKDE